MLSSDSPVSLHTGIAEITQRAVAFRKKLRRIKAGLAPPGFSWYPYDSLAVFHFLTTLLQTEPRSLLELVNGRPVLDIGCADGDLAFFFESLGCRVEAMDWPATNYNGMRGLRALKAALGSRVEIHEVDLDSQFRLPGGDYGLVLLLGLLYHLKNPYYVLEQLALATQCCLMSTRIAKLTPDRTTNLEHLPVAYLLGNREANDDITNYWIFSDAGLRRILTRTGWRMCAYLTTGNERDSDPVNRDRDQRAFCLTESRLANFPPDVRFLSGWHNAEERGARWTERRFSVGFRLPQTDLLPRIRLHFYLPGSSIEKLGSVTIEARVKNTVLPKETFSAAGQHVYARDLPPGLFDGGMARFDFELDKTIPPSETDLRELGIVVTAIGLGETVR